MELELLIGIELLQTRTELAAEDQGEGRDGKEKMRWRIRPARTVGRESAAGDDAVQMIMVQQGLAPGVQDGGDAQANTPAVLPKLQQGLAGCHKQQCIELALVLLNQRIELVRQREDQMEIRHRQQ